MTRTELARAVPVLLLSPVLAACALLTPLPAPSTTEERIAAFPVADMPVRDRVVIHWNAHMVPFIEAAHDTDLAFALGLVHAHLRLGQMAMMRRIATGRLAEMVGPVAADIDHSLRILDFGRAAPAIEAALPAATRVWLEAFVAGVNHYQAAAPTLPHEYAVLGLAVEPWTVRDVLTVGRLAATDVNWLVWFRLLRLRERADWPALWAALVADGEGAPIAAAGDGPDGLATLSGLLGGFSRSGSNSVAVAAHASETGAALIANDPHLGIFLPNLWLIAGYKSPSHHAVGLMVPGLPFIALGRNPHIAWGGTNMRAASSDLYDLSGLAPEDLTSRRETVAVRWWFDQEVTVRDSPFGPVISDAPVLGIADGPPIALRWRGHMASDEVTAMLAANRARDWRAFRNAFRDFAVSGQNMLYADVDGNIGQLMATQLPRRPTAAPADLVIAPGTDDGAWDALVDSTALPVHYNPAAGILVSANDRPAVQPVPIGWFFSPDDRVRRITALLERDGAVGIAALEAIQRDVVMPSAVALARVIVALVDGAGADAATDAGAPVLAALRAWDGHHDAGSAGALALEAVLHHLLPRFYGEARVVAYASAGRLRARLLADLEGGAPGALAPALRRALAESARTLAEHENWGTVHRLALAHPLARLPLVGGRYRFADLPVSGGVQTVMKTAHGNPTERHTTNYGSNARHISDMSDPDRNWFVLLGGQDGWLAGANFMDQVPLWRAGRYVEMPLRPETVRRTFPHRTVLEPRGG